MKTTILSLSLILSAPGQAQKLKTFTMSRTIQANSREVWAVISEVDQYHLYTSPGIQHVTMLEGEGEQAIRQCTDDKGRSWSETCAVWEPQQRYVFVVDTKSKDFKLPFRQFIGEWAIESTGTETCVLKLSFHYELKHKWILWMFRKKMNQQAEKDVRELLDNWEKEILRRKNQV